MLFSICSVRDQFSGICFDDGNDAEEMKLIDESESQEIVTGLVIGFVIFAIILIIVFLIGIKRVKEKLTEKALEKFVNKPSETNSEGIP